MMSDQEAIEGQLSLLDATRKRLRIQAAQQAKLGVFAPAYLQIEIDEARAQVQKIKGYLREHGEQVEDNPEDGEASLRAPETSPASVDVQAPPNVAESSQAGPVAQSPELASDSVSTTELADVFISYHPADKEWARKQLLPLLEQQHGLRAIIDYRDFEIGVPKVTNIEHAVANSRHTLIVLTPDWVANEWNSFHGLLASSADPGGLRAKLMPLILKPAALPDRIKVLEPSDLTDPDEREIQLDRLIRSIKRSRP